MASDNLDKTRDVSSADNLRRLVESALSGDTDSRKLLFEQLAPQVVRLVRRIVGQDHADDVVQEVFLVFFSRLKQFRFESSLNTWIYRLALNQSYQFLRSSSRESKRMKDYASGIDECEFDTDSGLAKREIVAKAMNDISPEQRAILQMKVVDGLDYDQISEILSIPIGTVGSRLTRARNELKESLIRLGWE